MTHQCKKFLGTKYFLPKKCTFLKTTFPGDLQLTSDASLSLLLPFILSAAAAAMHHHSSSNMVQHVLTWLWLITFQSYYYLVQHVLTWWWLITFQSYYYYYHMITGDYRKSADFHEEFFKFWSFFGILHVKIPYDAKRGPGSAFSIFGTFGTFF